MRERSTGQLFSATMARSKGGSEPMSHGASEVSWASGRARIRGGDLPFVRAGLNVRNAV